MGLGSKLGIFAQSGNSFTNNFSLFFDGTDDHIDFSTITYSGEFTFSFWVKPFDLSGAQINMLVGRSTSQDYVWLRGRGQARVSIGGSIIIFSETDESKKFNEDEWQHMLITRDSSNNVSIFRNGVEFGTSSTLSGTFTTDRFAKGGGTWFYKGGIDEIAIWTSDQSANAVKIYNLGEPDDLTTNGITSPTYWYRFEEGSGTVASNTISDSGVGTIDGALFSTDVP